MNEICEHCNKPLQQLNAPVEEYLEYKFCVNLFGWKLMLIKDYVDMGCPECLAEIKQERMNDVIEQSVQSYVSEQIESGNLIPKN